MKLPNILTLTLLSLTAASTASAVNLVIQSETSDQEIWDDGGAKWVGQAEIRVGNSGNKMTTGGVGFKLPELQPNEIITNVVFSIGLDHVSNTPNGNLDVHGLGVRSSSAPIHGDDFYFGQLPADDDYAVMLVDDFLSPTALANTNYSTADDAAATATLLDYVSSFYTAGAPEDDFLLLRLVIDSESESNSRYYEVFSANNAEVGMRPYLTITTVPEPSTTAGLLGFAALGLVFARRRLEK